MSVRVCIDIVRNVGSRWVFFRPRRAPGFAAIDCYGQPIIVPIMVDDAYFFPRRFPPAGHPSSGHALRGWANVRFGGCHLCAPIKMAYPEFFSSGVPLPRRFIIEPTGRRKRRFRTINSTSRPPTTFCLVRRRGRRCPVVGPSTTIVRRRDEMSAFIATSLHAVQVFV